MDKGVPDKIILNWVVDMTVPSPETHSDGVMHRSLRKPHPRDLYTPEQECCPLDLRVQTQHFHEGPEYQPGYFI